MPFVETGIDFAQKKYKRKPMLRFLATVLQLYTSVLHTPQWLSLFGGKGLSKVLVRWGRGVLLGPKISPQISLEPPLATRAPNELMTRKQFPFLSTTVPHSCFRPGLCRPSACPINVALDKNGRTAGSELLDILTVNELTGIPNSPKKRNSQPIL